MSDQFNIDTSHFDNGLLYPGDQDEDLQGVLDALIELHQLDADKAKIENFEYDYASIVEAINLNQAMQQKVISQIEFIDQLLLKNETTTTEARYSANAENRFGQRLILHSEYKNDISYFDASELIENAPVSTPLEEEDESAEEEEYEEDDEDHVDSEKRLTKKSWSRAERLRLTAGIHSEAKRSTAYDFMKKDEEWRVWEVDKIDKAQLEIFPVSRLDWDRISTIHVLTRTKNECLIQWTTQEHPIINKKPWSKQESQNLSELVEKIGMNGQWERIASELSTNRTISQCFSHYMADKNNKSARSLKWNAEEDAKLGAAVKTYGDCNWQLIAAAMKGRTGQQCLHRWTKSINPAIVRTKWSEEESELLKRAVQLYGQGNWTKVQRLLPGRTDMQCRERFCNILTPGVVRTKMSEEEVLQLVSLVEKIGPKWSYLADFFPGRTDNNMLRSYSIHMNAQKRKKEKEERDAIQEQKKKEKAEAKQAKQRLKEGKATKKGNTAASIPRKRGRRKKLVVVSPDVSEEEVNLAASGTDSEAETYSDMDLEPIIADPSEPESVPPKKRSRMSSPDEDYTPNIPLPLPVIQRCTRSKRNAMV